jgi:mono/diheme cytochrome c family protein
MLFARSLWLCLWAAVATSAMASEATDLYANKCAVCHGDDGKGQTKMGRKFHSPDFTTAKWQAETKDEEIVRAIEKGVVVDGQHRMPAWKGKLTPLQISDLGKLTRTFGHAKQ